MRVARSRCCAGAHAAAAGATAVSRAGHASRPNRPPPPPPAPPPATPPAPPPAAPPRLRRRADDAARRPHARRADLSGRAVHLTSYDAGRGQRFYLFGSTASFAGSRDVLPEALKQSGELVFDAPATHEFLVGRFREETMAFPPGVTIKDYKSAISQGYPESRSRAGSRRGSRPSSRSCRSREVDRRLVAGSVVDRHVDLRPAPELQRLLFHPRAHRGVFVRHPSSSA